MPDDTAEMRRVDDRRIDRLDAKISNIGRDVSSIRDMLISEPAASPLGRVLEKRANENAGAILALDGRVDGLETWRDEWKGVWRLFSGLGVVLGIIATFFSILAFFGPHP